MSEEENKGAEEAIKNNDGRDKSETESLIDKANLSAERLERANKRKEEILNREEQLMVTQALSGRTNGGKEEEKPKEETPEEYAKRIMKNE